MGEGRCVPPFHVTLQLTYMYVVAQRVQWFRSRANLVRTNEEVTLIYAEGRALRRGFSYASEEWLRRDCALPEYASPGATAYAREKSDMFQRMSGDCERLIKRARERNYAAMDSHPTRKDAFDVTQKVVPFSNTHLNYSVVSANVSFTACHLSK